MGLSGRQLVRTLGLLTPQRPDLPSTSNPAWVRTPVDAFILARLDQEHVSPSPEADRITLIRRLSLDLIGLPPTIEEVDAFLADPAPDAYDRLVERLLASPHYGERWGRLWLDAARYADSDGYEKDKPRFVWAYRDYVINSLNDDLPYNQFLIEQIAGDLLENPSKSQQVATGYLRNSMINEEGGIDPEQFRMEAMFDRMDAIGKGILGLTIQCAQCHTHKYDPLTHEDYYRMFAFLNNAHEANIAVYSPDAEKKRQDVLNRIRDIENDLKSQNPDWPSLLAAWEDEVRARDLPSWTIVRPEVDDISTGGAKYLPQPDGSFLQAGYAPTKHRVKMTVKVDSSEPIRAFRLEQLTDPTLPLGGPGRSIYGTSALTEFAVEAAPATDPNKKTNLKIASATADVYPPVTPIKPAFHDKSDNAKRVTGPVSLAIDGKNETAWGIDIGPGRRNQPRHAVFVLEEPIHHDGGTLLTFYLTQNHGGWNSDDNQNYNLGRFRLSCTTADHAEADPIPARVRTILDLPKNKRTEAQNALVFSHWRTTVPEWCDVNLRIEEIWQEHPESSSQLALKERSDPRMTSLLTRGDFLKPAHEVEPGVPSFLHPLPPNAPRNRLTFARWLASRQSPTTARALVNRVWQAYFSTGLVATPEDLGTQGDRPSHPELLDWLAVEFMDNGWHLKNLHRLIVKSSTYRQSSKVSPESLAKDPSNRLLARGPRFRVDAEIVRDIALASSGLLDPEIGGPSVQPPAPDFLFQPPASYGPKVWNVETGPERYRRALYTFRYRSVPYPALQAFDAPNGDVACVRRSRSNTPLQALTTLNEPVFLECARALAHTAIENGGDTDSDRLSYAFRRCLSRSPTETEREILLRLLDRETTRFQQPNRDPSKLAFDGLPPARASAWTTVARVLLNLDETISKE